MSHIDDLIQRLCPHGVEFKPLGEIGEVFRGRRFVKTDYADEGIGAIHYGELYTHYGTTATEVLTRVRADLRPNLRFVKPGDVVIAEVGETLEDVGKATAWLGTEEVAIHDGCYGFRHPMDPAFVAYYMQTPAFKAAKNPYVARAKVKRLSLDGLRRLRVPTPPLEIQREIVRALGELHGIERELRVQLRAELGSRRSQYLFFRDSLLKLDAPQRALGQLAEVGTGSRNTNEATPGGRYPFFVRSQEPLLIDEAEFDETAVITAGDGVGVGKVFHYVEGKYALHQRAYRLRVTSADLNPRFFFHFIRHDFGRYLATTSVHSSVTSLRRPMFERYCVPLPPLATQARIVETLDSFEAQVDDLASNLRQELSLRPKQYEYYRNKLLTFEEAV